MSQENTGNIGIPENEKADGIHFGFIGESGKEFLYVFLMKFQKTNKIAVIAPDFKYLEQLFFGINPDKVKDVHRNDETVQQGNRNGMNQYPVNGKSGCAEQVYPSEFHDGVHRHG